MYRNDPYIVLTRDGAAKIAGSSESRGSLTMRYVPSDDLFVVSIVETSEGVRSQVDIPPEYRTLRGGDLTRPAQWMRQPADELNINHFHLLRRPGAVVGFDGFRKMVPRVVDPGAKSGILLTHHPDLPPDLREIGVREFAGWILNREGVRPIHVEVEPTKVGIQQLSGTWPIERLRANSVMVVGCGSIGSAAADALARYGIGRVELVDPDRLLWHNTLRHTLGPKSVGRHKVSAIKDEFAELWPELEVRAHRLDIVEDAHLVRSLVDDVDLVLCTADGIAPRRVASHLARRASKSAVLACVLDHGAIGEVVRLRPTPRFGCLLCLRSHLASSGAMDAEADQELDYGTGRVHQPMVATPPDLRFVGTLAAKVAVATLLESQHGDHTQHLPGEHAIVGLRPGGDLAPPFDVRTPGEVRWAAIPRPRPGCPTCTVDE